MLWDTLGGWGKVRQVARECFGQVDVLTEWDLKRTLLSRVLKRTGEA